MDEIKNTIDIKLNDLDDEKRRIDDEKRSLDRQRKYLLKLGIDVAVISGDVARKQELESELNALVE